VFPDARRLPVVALVGVALIAWSSGACSRVASPRDWIASAELVAGGTVTIAVRDESGRIDNAEIDPPGVVVAAPVSNPAGQPNVVIVSWVGGACDRQTDIGVMGAGQGLAVTVHTTVAPGDCDAIGVGHVVRLTSSEPLPAAAVTVRTEPGLAG
jgi:hypothetical protein